MSDNGPWYSPKEAGPKLGRTARKARELCQDGLIDHQRIESPSGYCRYLISEAAITGYLRRNTVRAVT